MAGGDRIGGKCPICSSSMFQKWHSCGEGFMFDACANCGYIATSVDSFSKDEYSKAIDMILSWRIILDICGHGTLQEFSKSLQKLEASKTARNTFRSGKNFDVVQRAMNTNGFQNYVKGWVNCKAKTTALLAVEGIEVGDTVITFEGDLSKELLSETLDRHPSLHGAIIGKVLHKEDFRFLIKWETGDESEVDVNEKIIFAIDINEYSGLSVLL